MWIPCSIRPDGHRHPNATRIVPADEDSIAQGGKLLRGGAGRFSYRPFTGSAPTHWTKTRPPRSSLPRNGRDSIPSIVHVLGSEEAGDLSNSIRSPPSWRRVLPGGLTLVLPRSTLPLALLVSGGLPTAHPRPPIRSRVLCGIRRVPIAAPSANRAGISRRERPMQPMNCRARPT